MKKTSLILGTCLFLSACGGYEIDLDKTAEIRNENRRVYHQEYGCSLMKENESYRQCILNTYQKNTPKTYITDNTADGKSLAIIRNDTTSSYDAERGTYKTERVVVIETEERLVPIESASNQSEYEEAEIIYDETIGLEENELTEGEETLVQLPELDEPKLTEIMPTPDSEKSMIGDELTTEIVEETEITETQSTEMQPTEVQPAEEIKTTWWETYQQEKEPEIVPELKCPCEDPNDPCLHCVEK